MSQVASVIDELEHVLAVGPGERRTEILRRVTDLFIGNADNFDPPQIAVFDDVLARLIREVETKALAELGTRLAPIEKAPAGVIRTLAFHDEIEVAAPVISQSPQLTDADLVRIAQTKGQGHLSAMSERRRLAAAVTDILIQRGETNIVRKLSKNAGARFSEKGYVTLATRAERDEDLAENLGLRLDMPPELLQTLMAKATETVRARLLAIAPPESRSAIQEVLSSVSEEFLRKATAPRDFSRAIALIDKMQGEYKLNEAAIAEFATTGKYEELLVGLARVSGASVELIERVMQNVRYDGVLVACKAAEFRWPTFMAVLKARWAAAEIPANDLNKARADFLKLSVPTARRMLRFWLVRGAAKVEL
ncbi:MAG TPA: DUF2336 domain-containing protein [Pseudolabrys sp.]|nr:DUF2336 domain-containing protein [Pseudolabrys sp.]